MTPQPKDQPDTAEAKIREIARNICYEHFDCDEPECLQRKVNDEAVEQLKGLLVDAQNKVLADFVDWHNNKYDTGYESGIAPEHIKEFLALQQTRQEEVRQ